MGMTFHEKELTVTGTKHMKTSLFQQDVNIYQFPVTAREGFLAPYKRKPIWVPYNVEKQMVTPKMIPDNVARGAVGDVVLRDEEKGGPDMFGIIWEYVPQVGGSMVRPGNPLLDSIDEWREKVVFPDIDSWDWKGGAESWAKVNIPDLAHIFTFHNGFWFERLVSFMGFEDAAVALIDEEQQEAVHDLFEATTDLACRLVDKVCQYFDVDGFFIHDDWGSMLNSFFSVATCREMIVPHMKKLTDHIHAKGKIADLHSCGKIDNQLPNIIAAGWDSWNPMNICDTDAMFQEYGDQIVLSVLPPKFDPLTTPPEQQREYARQYVERYCVPGKWCAFNNYAMSMLTPAFSEELYICSRKKYAEMY